jgi:hypothetical protein
MEKSTFLQTFNMEFFNSIRSNHALEHATFHVLEGKGIKMPLFGLSDAGGFWVAGNVAPGELLDSAYEALTRLQGGEVHLALHENCGTNLVATGTIAGGMAWLGMLGAGKGFFRKLGRLPLVICMASIGLLIAQPLGPMIQEKVTTLSNGQKREVVSVQRWGLGSWTIQRIVTRQLES